MTCLGCVALVAQSHTACPLITHYTIHRQQYDQASSAFQSSGLHAWVRLSSRMPPIHQYVIPMTPSPIRRCLSAICSTLINHHGHNFFLLPEVGQPSHRVDMMRCVSMSQHSLFIRTRLFGTRRKALHAAWHSTRWWPIIHPCFLPWNRAERRSSRRWARGSTDRYFCWK